MDNRHPAKAGLLGEEPPEAADSVRGPGILAPPEEGFQILQCHERRWCSDFLDDWWSDLATSTVERSHMVATEFLD
jgi:hypothetical protein